jgi:Rho GDP-dissociation inhibitor
MPSLSKKPPINQLKFIFTVRSNIVSGLTCINTVWKAGIMVQEMRSMLGTFAPQQEPYVHILAEQLTPSWVLARGPYSARRQFIDDDGTVYLDVNYSFEICKDW